LEGASFGQGGARKAVGMDVGFSAARVGLRFIAVDSEVRGPRRLRASGEWSHSMASVTGRGDDGPAALREEG
jgi:hypothetical protein